MLFNENDEPHLKAWIIGRLANEYVFYPYAECRWMVMGYWLQSPYLPHPLQL